MQSKVADSVIGLTGRHPATIPPKTSQQFPGLEVSPLRFRRSCQLETTVAKELNPDTSFSADRMQNHDFRQIGDHNAFNPRPMPDLDLNALLEFGVGSGGIIYHIAT